MNFPKLYHLDSHGNLREWSIWTEDNLVKTKWGLLDGKLMESSYKAKGKNSGRSNATTDSQQAELEAKSHWTNKVERKYSETPEKAELPLMLPMLAKEYNLKHISFPLCGQPKLDGVRCLAFWKRESRDEVNLEGTLVTISEERIVLLSRSGKEWTVPTHIKEDLATWLPKDIILDGELYLHGSSCQKITSYVKKHSPTTDSIAYHVYDIADENLTFLERDTLLASLFSSPHPHCVRVPTVKLPSHNDLDKLHNKFVKEGYEGLIARVPDGKYSFGFRSNTLLKYKKFQDSEFTVIDVIDGIGKYEGLACFICQNDSDTQTFECTMSATFEEKTEQFKNKEKYLNKKLTIRYFGRTDGNLPRFPVGVCFRDEKDL